MLNHTAVNDSIFGLFDYTNASPLYRFHLGIQKFLKMMSMKMGYSEEGSKSSEQFRFSRCLFTAKSQVQ